MNLRTAIIGFVALALAPFAGAARAAEPAIPLLWDPEESFAKPDLSDLPRLRFLTTTDFPPFNFIDGSGRLAGFHVDLARAICAELDVAERCQIQALPWGELDAALAGKIGEAILAGSAVTAQSRERYAFSRPYLVFPARFVTLRDSPLAEPMYAALRGKRVGVVAGSAHERMLRDYFPNATAVPLASPDLIFTELKAAKIDAAFGDGMRQGAWLSEAQSCCRYAGGPYVAPEYLGFGLSVAAAKDAPELAAAFDYALHEISAKGVFAELYLRHFPVSFF